MRRIIYISLIAISLAFQSCLKEDDEIFDKSTSERMSEVIAKYRSDLQDSQYGWALEYYAEVNQSYGGYVYAIQFKSDSAIVAIDAIGSIEKSASLYNIVSDNGPVLTFDAYNENMHLFANPTQSLTEGYQGDYEFIFMENRGDTIVLKGKKTGTKMLLYKLKESADSFIDKIKKNYDLVADAPCQSLFVNGEEISTNRELNFFQFSVIENGTEKDIFAPYICTTTGIHFYNPITIDGVVFQDFVVDDDEEGLTCKTDDAVKIKFEYPSINEQLGSTRFQWYLGASDEYMSESAYEGWFSILLENYNTYGEILTSFYLGKNAYGSASFPYAFVFNSEGYQSAYGINIVPVENTENEVEIALTGKAYGYIDDYTHLQPWILLILKKSPFILSTNNEKTPDVITLTSKNDPDFWFIIGKRKTVLK